MELRSRAAAAAAAGSVLAALVLVQGCDGPRRDRQVEQIADDLLSNLHSRGLFSGAVVLGRGGEELYARGFGAANIDAGIPFTPDTPADGGSVAKTLTAAAVLMLEDEGRLTLDDEVRQHVNEYPHAGTRVRHLLTHSAGLPETEYDFFNDFIPAGRVRTTAMFLDVLRQRDVAPAFEPGTRFSYSSLGFDVAALMVERVSGQSWEQFLRERVFEPLGMRATFLRPPRLADWPGVRTLSYRPAGGRLAVHDVFDNEGFYGGSNLYFSARDLHRWSRSFYTHPVLSEAALTRGTEAAVLSNPASGTGGRSALNLLSWYYADGRRYQYPGSLQGFWTSVYRDEQRAYSVIYTSNSSMPQWLRPRLTRALIEIVEGGTPVAIPTLSYVDVGARDVDRIAGRYAVAGVGRVTIGSRTGGAFLRVEQGIEYPAFFVDDGQLYVPGLDVWVGFPASAATPFDRLTWLSIFHVADGARMRQ